MASVQFEAETASFTCTFNLAPGEMAKLKISAYIYAHELKVHYENVALFSVPSKGEIILQDSIGKKNAWQKFSVKPMSRKFFMKMISRKNCFSFG